MNYKITILLLSLTIGCNIQKEKADTFNKLETVEICSIAQLQGDSLATVLINEPKQVIGQANQPNGDSCLLSILAKISQTVLVKADSRYLVALDSLGKHSDGFLSESLSEAMVTLFDERLEYLLKYLRSTEDSDLTKYLRYGLSMDISVQGTKQERLDDALSRFTSIGDQEFLSELFEKVDPEQFD